MKPKKQWKIFLIHHSHTDIGYTESQERIASYHVDFIKQVVDIGREGNPGFVWQCENYWQIENFYKHAPADYIKDFEAQVKEGKIGLSANYLNMTELINYDILAKKLKSATDYSNKIGVDNRSGMSADINGYAWGYAQALHDAKIENLLCCLHTHHGMFALRKKQQPFFWETPKGDNVLVWMGEHYHLGNELMFAPLAGTSYTIYDEYNRLTHNNLIFNEDYDTTIAQEQEILEKRVISYLANLEDEGYPFDFVPVMISGAITDNSPPNANITKRLEWIKENMGDYLTVEMSTLDTFFNHVRKNAKDVPVYKGDWPDWWADGVSSTPQALKLFKDGQRKYELLGKMEPAIMADPLVKSAEDNFMLFAEHTWGYSSSIIEPWESMVGELELKKIAYATNAHTDIYSAYNKALAGKGEKLIRAGAPHTYKIINPHNTKIKGPAYIYLGLWEYMDGAALNKDIKLKALNSATGAEIPCKIKNIVRAYEIEVLVELEANSEMEITIQKDNTVKRHTVQNHAYVGADGVEDILIDGVYEANYNKIETDHFIVKIKEGWGIDSIIDKSSGKNIICQDVQHPLFSGIYELTPAPPEGQKDVRRLMGRNRKTKATIRDVGYLNDINVVDDNSVYVSLELSYILEGTEFYKVALKIYKTIAKIEAKVMLHKTSVWSPENLYVSLPLTIGEGGETYIDKTGCTIRPGKDQLPGTNLEFYLTQNGMLHFSHEETMIVCLKDAPLVTFGSLEAKPITLSSANTDISSLPSYNWIMNNYWETNFKADLAGFYEFAYSIDLVGKQTLEQAEEKVQAISQGLVAFRT